jgi:PAS domain S-box-containing protein
MFARNISELKSAEDALLGAKADLARSQEAARLGSYVWDIATGQATWSDELYHIFGMEPGESTPSIEEYLSLVHPDDRKLVDEAIKETLSSGKPFDIDHRVQPRDGSVRYVHSVGDATFDRAGKVAIVYGTIQDITVRKLIEIERDDLKRQLSSERARLEAVLRNIPAGIVIAEAPSGRVVTINGQMEQIFRHAFPFSSGIEEYGEWGVFQSGGRRYEPEDFPLARSIRTGEVVSEEEVSFLRGDGTWGLVSINSAPIYDGEGRIADAIATFFDITERRKAENALRESESNLARAQLIAHLGNWVWIIEKNEMRYSEEMCRIYGLTHDQYNSTFEAFISLVHPEDREPVRRSINAALNRKEPHSIDFRIIRPDGVERFVHSEGEVIFDNASKPVRMFATVQDISDRKQVEEALRDAKRQAELYLDLMSHDINNMNMIGMGYLELALERLKLDDEGRVLLQKPLEVLKNSSTLIDNVRKTRRAVTGELGLSRIDVGQMLEEIIKVYEKAPVEGVTIHYTQAMDHYVMANELLKDVFTNLIDNAIKHSKKPVTVGINLSWASKGDGKYNKISIEDNGPGIPDELKDKVFNRMSRGDTRARGSGLGLYLVRTLVDSYKGNVWVEDRVPGDYRQGSRFVVLLPAVD